MTVGIHWKFPNWLEKINQAEQEIQLFVAAIIQMNRGMVFDQEGAYNGHDKWAPLKLRSGQILSDRGDLRRSIAPKSATGKPGPGGIVSFGTNTVTVGTSLKYAPLMNWGTTGLPGGVIKPIHAKALRFKCGDKVIFAQQVKIPARHFDEWNTQDKDEMTESLTNKVAQILNRE